MAVVRYLVDDADAAVAFYTEQLGFTLAQRMGPAFAIVELGDLSLWLSGPQSSAARAMPDGRRPEPEAAIASSLPSTTSRAGSPD